MAFWKKSTLSRVENPCFLLFLIIFQVIFILILYRGRSSVVVQDPLDMPSKVDYSKAKDVYTNLNLYSPVPDKATMPHCTAKTIMNVGPLNITFDTLPSEKTIIDKNPYVRSGGCYSPPHCLTTYKTAVIVPYRNHEKQLRHFLYYLHPFLQRQQIYYCIYLIRQAGNGPFNRAKLLNVGVLEALKDDDWNCLFLHSVDLIPENDYNFYLCEKNYPKLVSSAIDKLDYSLPHWSFFGGVTSMTPEHYLKINGFPNTYWDRDGDNEDIAERIHIVGLRIYVTPLVIGRYKVVEGKEPSRLTQIMRSELQTSKTWKDDGMNSLDFKLLSKKRHPLYTNITVDIGAAPVHGKKKRNIYFFGSL